METLNKENLEEKLKVLDATFDKIQKEIKGIENQENMLNQQKSERNVELFRLQGEHRLLTSLLEKKEPGGMKEVV